MKFAKIENETKCQNRGPKQKENIIHEILVFTQLLMTSLSDKYFGAIQEAFIKNGIREKPLDSVE